MIDQKNVIDILIDTAKKLLADIHRRSAESLKLLEQKDFLLALGALAGFEQQLRYVTIRLMVLSELKRFKHQIQKQNEKERRKHGS